MTRNSILFVLFVVLVGRPLDAQADAISDALQAASDAYAAGDLYETSVQVNTAIRELALKKKALLIALLPEAPEGWTREISEEFAAGMATMSGATGTEASYVGPETSFVVNVMADNVLIQSMLELYSTPETMAMMGNVIKVGSIDMVDQGEGGLMGVVGGRVMVTTRGDTPTDVIIPILATTDFDALAVFDK